MMLEVKSEHACILSDTIHLGIFVDNASQFLKKSSKTFGSFFCLANNNKSSDINYTKICQGVYDFSFNVILM